MIEGVVVTSLSVFETVSGDVLHGMKCSDQGFSGFGEAYFSDVDCGAVKAWKRHQEMVLNLIVPVGAIHFVIYDDRKESKSFNQFQEITLSRNDNYCRLTVPSMLWVGFQGTAATNMLLNIANIVHSSGEMDQKTIDEIPYDWAH